MQSIDPKDLVLAFSLVDGVGIKTYLQIVEKFGDLANFIKETNAINKHTVLIKKIRSQLINLPNLYKQLDCLGINVYTLIDDSYPRLLREIPDPPLAIYVKGSLAQTSKSLAVVGTRKITSDGSRITTQFVSELESTTVVSGMAFGVDTVAHAAAIASGLHTIAVLASSVDEPTPRGNSNLFYKILDNDGAIVSEIPPGLSLNNGMFIRRNRIIAGLSQATLVTQAGIKSGALATAKFALDYNRDVYTVPGSPLQSNWEGNNRLIRNNIARLVVNPQDLLLDLGLDKSSQAVRMPALPENQMQLYNLLLEEPLSLDMICAKIGDKPSSLLAILTDLEIGGRVINRSDGKYQVVS